MLKLTNDHDARTYSSSCFPLKDPVESLGPALRHNGLLNRLDDLLGTGLGAVIIYDDAALPSIGDETDKSGDGFYMLTQEVRCSVASDSLDGE
jgi:hypothetical protein